MRGAAGDISVYGRGGESHGRVSATKRLSAVLPVPTRGDARENRLGRLDQSRVTLSHGHVLEKVLLPATSSVMTNSGDGLRTRSIFWWLECVSSSQTMLALMLSTDLTRPETRILIKHLWDIGHR